MNADIRNLLVGTLFIALIITLATCWWYGQRLIRTERTDAVFGNPVRALGGWHWVISGVSFLLVVWLYFSWDAARAFYPRAANEMCQIAKVATAVNPMRSIFPFESRLLQGTAVLDREGRQIATLERTLQSDRVSDSERALLSPLVADARALLESLSAPGSLDPEVTSALADIATRMDVLTGNFESGELPEGTLEAVAEALEAQPGWGDSGTEIPADPITERGALFSVNAMPLAQIASDFVKIRNQSPRFLSDVEALYTAIDSAAASVESPAAKSLARTLDKLLKRVDNGQVFPPGSLVPVEASLARFHEAQSDRQGSLKLIDAIAMPGGTVLAGNTACSEQGSGRWLPKPSDTLGTLVRMSNPEIGYKGIPLLWYEQKPLAEMVGFFIPDFVADLVPGEYPRHDESGGITPNFKTKVLNLATGNFAWPSVPVPTGHMWDSILRVVTGLFFGILLGVPLGLFMGLSRFAKGFFDPLIELYRPVPPLAWAPLILTIFGIQDDGKIFLLFMVAFAIMVISARTGATGTQLSKIHAAHSLGASRWQIVREVILPNSLPEILTGIRISIGVCWGTLVAAEMLAGTTGIGFLENVARKQSDYEVIWVTIILLGVLGLIFDLIMRWVIARTIPWRGKG